MIIRQWQFSRGVLDGGGSVSGKLVNLEQTPLNRCLQLPAPYKRLIDDVKETVKQ